ncbi:MAG: rhomboid family intramembrane serine protease [Myxococcales bacterium]|nr:rhomboid family intramembrane serine protease [Myxococcales bacterium]MDH5565083.1 rhomboid family intramembrane serine protease [Myxococcales bacterium]
MFPLRDDNPTLGTSVATFAIIGMNIAAWIFVQGLGSEPALSQSICELGAIPGDLLGTLPHGTVVPMGQGMSCVIGGDPNWLTPLTSMFLHGGWFHIIGNLWFLSVFGDNVEDSMGPLRFALFYVLCGLAAVAVQMFASPGSPVPMVGASGAISGVMGAYALLYPRVSVHMLIFLGFFFTRLIVPAWFMLGYWFLLQILGGIPALEGAGGGVAFWAHVGGFAAGALLIPIFRDPQRIAAHRAHVAMLWARERR